MSFKNSIICGKPYFIRKEYMLQIIHVYPLHSPIKTSCHLCESMPRFEFLVLICFWGFVVCSLEEEEEEEDFGMDLIEEGGNIENSLPASKSAADNRWFHRFYLFKSVIWLRIET